MPLLILPAYHGNLINMKSDKFKSANLQNDNFRSRSTSQSTILSDITPRHVRVIFVHQNLSSNDYLDTLVSVTDSNAYERVRASGQSAVSTVIRSGRPVDACSDLTTAPFLRPEFERSGASISCPPPPPSKAAVVNPDYEFIIVRREARGQAPVASPKTRRGTGYYASINVFTRTRARARQRIAWRYAAILSKINGGVLSIPSPA